MGTVMVVAAWAIVLVGLVLVLRGVWGVRISDLPRCRKCRFDLSGIPAFKAVLEADGSTRASRCPECGRDVWKPGSMRIGAWRRGPVFGLGSRGAIAGFALLVLGSGWLGMIGMARYAGARWYPMLPSWVLIEYANGVLGRADEAVMKEVVARIPSLVSGPGVSGGAGTSAGVIAPGSWTSEQLRVLANRAEDGIKGTSSGSMMKAWLRIYREAMGRPGLTTDAQSSRVAAAIVHGRIQARPMVRAGESLWIQFEPVFRVPRFEAEGVVWASRRVWLQVKQPDGSWGERIDVRFGSQFVSSRSYVGLLMKGETRSIDLAPGRYEVRLSGEHAATMSPDSTPLGGSWKSQEAILSAVPVRTTEWTGTVQVVERDVAAVEMDSSEASVRAFGEGARVSMFRWRGRTAAEEAAIYGADGVVPAIWELLLRVESSTAVPLESVRISVQGKDERGVAIGEAWQMMFFESQSSGGIQTLVAMPTWRGGGQLRADRHRLDAPFVDVTIEPSLLRYESSMQTRVVAARLKFSNVPVINEPGSVHPFRPLPGMPSNEQRWRPRTKPDEHGGVSAITGEDLLRGYEEERVKYFQQP